METVTISKEKYEQMQREIKTLRNTDLYKKLLKSLAEFKKDAAEGKEYTRKDLGF